MQIQIIAFSIDKDFLENQFAFSTWKREEDTNGHFLTNGHFPQKYKYLLQNGNFTLFSELFLCLLFLKSNQPETEQDPMVLAPHVLSLPFVCGKTLAKEYV